MIYVDTSVIVPLLTSEPRSPDVITWYSALNETPTCSDWLLTEFSSAVSIKLRTGQLNEANAKRARKEFELLTAGGLHVVSVSRNAFKQAARLHSSGLRSGDSLHLAVALELGASHMATLDVNLAANVKRHGIKNVF